MNGIQCQPLRSNGIHFGSKKSDKQAEKAAEKEKKEYVKSVNKTADSLKVLSNEASKISSSVTKKKESSVVKNMLKIALAPIIVGGTFAVARYGQPMIIRALINTAKGGSAIAKRSGESGRKAVKTAQTWTEKLSDNIVKVANNIIPKRQEKGIKKFLASSVRYPAKVIKKFARKGVEVSEENPLTNKKLLGNFIIKASGVITGAVLSITAGHKLIEAGSSKEVFNQFIDTSKEALIAGPGA